MSDVPFWRAPEVSSAPAPSRLPRWLRPRRVYISPSTRRSVEVAVAVVIGGLLLSVYNPALLIAATTTTGGDTGAHVYAAWFMREELLPQGVLSGWSNAWLEGVPMFHFYFPLAALAIAALSYVIPFDIAFKLVTAIGPFLFPVAAYILFRLLRVDFPAPVLAAILATAFLFMDSFSIYGANLASTIAGEFAFSIGFALVLIFTGLFYRLMTDARARPLLAAFVLAAAALTHLVPVMMTVLVAPAFLFWGTKALGWKEGFRRAGVVAGIAAGATALWSLPFLARIGWTTSFGTAPLEGFAIAFPKQLWVYTAGTILAAALAFVRRDRRVLVLLLPGVAGLGLYLTGLKSLIWNGRWLPFWYVSAFLCTAYVLGAAIPIVARALSRRRAVIGSLVLTAVTIAVATGWILWKRNGSFVRHWAAHNYSGYERTAGWNTFDAIHDVLRDLPAGRVIAEDADQAGEFGTTFAFMAVPYFTQQSTAEGLFFESSISTPFVNMLQAELSEQPSLSISYVPYQDFDLERAARHMRALDISYLIAASDLTREAARATGQFDEIATVDSYTVFALDPPRPVVIPEYEPVVVPERVWDDAKFEWWTELQTLSVPVAMSGPDQWERVESYGSGVPSTPLPHGGEAVTAQVQHDEISFTTEAIGEPHIVRISHFPNWRAEGADGPYRIAPSFMVVIPNRPDVRLIYERTWAEWVGLTLSAATVAALAIPRSRRALVSWGGAGG